MVRFELGRRCCGGASGALSRLEQDAQARLDRAVGAGQKLRRAALFEDVAARDRGAHELARQRDRHREIGALRCEDVELLVGALEIAGEAEQVGEERPGVGVGGALADQRRLRFDGRGQRAFGE